MAAEPNASIRQRLPTITVSRVRCPACNGVRLEKYRSVTDKGNGTGVAWVRCQTCHYRFRLILQ